MRWRVLAAATIMITLAGCGGAPDPVQTPTSTSSPTSSWKPKINRDSIRAVDVVGDDYQRFDPCSLVDLKTLSISGEAALTAPLSFDECRVFIDAAAPVHVTVGPWREAKGLIESGKPGVAGLPGGLTGLVLDSDPGACRHAIVFTDKVVLEVNVEPAGDGPVAACEIAEQAVTSVSSFALVERGKQRRTPEAKSLSTVDACGLLPAATLRGAEQQPRLSGHSCFWFGADDTVPDVRLLLSQGYGDDLAETGTPVTIAGRASFVEQSPPGAGPVPACKVTVNHMPSRVDALRDLTEQATVMVFGPTGGDPCALAKSLAEAAWPNLPTP